MATDALLQLIERFLADTGMGASYFGQRAVGNSKLVRRLREGRSIELDTAHKVQRFMKAEMDERRAKAQAILRSARRTANALERAQP